MTDKQAHLDPESTPKRILGLDGGGVRGVLTLEYLAELERLLRDRYDDPDLVLSDYFDLIGGTSTGAIIAACLASGQSVGEITDLYETLASDVFERTWWRRGVLFAKYTNRRLESALKAHFRDDTLLGSDSLRTGLMIMTKRMDTGSPWVLTNHPANKYWSSQPGTRRIPNSEFPLWRVIRASTAAPHYFKPETFDVAKEEIDGRTIVQQGQFIDGGVSTANNPALQLLQVATVDGFAFNWELGEDQILLVSVGTGHADPEIGAARGIRRLAAGNAGTALLGLMGDCADHVETMMQWMSNSRTARTIDRQIGDLGNDLLGGEALLTYVRYNVRFEAEWMSEHLGLEYDRSRLQGLARMDDPTTMRELQKIGARAADVQVAPEDLPARFDLRPHHDGGP